MTASEDKNIPPWERLDFKEAVIELFGTEYGKEWLSSPNVKLLLRTPEELLGTPEEPLVRDIIRGALVVGIS